MAKESAASIFDHFGIWFPARPESAIGQSVLMAHGDQTPHEKIGNGLATCSRWLVWRARIVSIWLSSSCSFFEDGLFITDILEHL